MTATLTQLAPGYGLAPSLLWEVQKGPDGALKHQLGPGPLAWRMSWYQNDYSWAFWELGLYHI